METTLPDLPFNNYGEPILEPWPHSSAKATPWAYPRTDLATFRPWMSFPDDIHNAIRFSRNHATLSSTPMVVGRAPLSRPVESEQEIHTHATTELHDVVQEVVNRLGVVGRFRASGSGRGIIGSPDFSWITNHAQPHPKLVVEYKPCWVVNLENLPAAFENPGVSTHSQQSFDALEQVYGYMTFNNNKFGILSNWYHAWFLQRIETSDCKTLEYFHVELGGPNQPVSMLKAWVGIVLLTEGDRFYASPTPIHFPPTQYFGDTPDAWRVQKIQDAGDYHAPLVNGRYNCLDLDFHLCHFNLSTSRNTSSCVVNAQFLQPSVTQCDLHVICKIVDVSHYPAAGDSLQDEADAYPALQPLQGSVIPTFYGFYQVWGILRLLALQPVGDAIPEDEEIDWALHQKMKDALQHIHNAQYIHGDIAHHNFCRTEEGAVFLVDLEMCQPAQGPSELEDEMNKVDLL